MPYKSEKLKIEGTDFDRRRRVSQEDIEKMYYLRESEYTYTQIARIIGVDRHTIMRYLNPSYARYLHNKCVRDWKEHQGSREEHTTAVRNTRRYKQQLYLDNKIGFDE